MKILATFLNSVHGIDFIKCSNEVLTLVKILSKLKN
jgi:hypothetical protein